jgi:hypothetical protein
MENHSAYVWLGCEFLNGTFKDDTELMADIADVEVLLAFFEDEPCSE